MTYTKLIESLRELADRECYPDDKMLTDAANALEKNYAELDNQSMQLAHDAVTIECLNDKVMAMQAKLDELTKQEPVIDFTVLHQFASDQAISYNKLCTAVRMCLAAPKALAPLTDEQIDKGQWDDGTSRTSDFYEGVRFAEKHHGIGGTP